MARRRNILFVTTDQQRWDALGCNGGTLARTPAVDGLARGGINYTRPHVQNVVCMPSRATMATGQYPRTHGVVCNGVALPEDSPTIMRVLSDAGYHTGLVGKAHFEPLFDLRREFPQNQLAPADSTGPWLGFDHVELAVHAPIPTTHYGRFLAHEHPRALLGFGWLLSGLGGGETGAPEVKVNPIPRGLYHTDWVRDRAEGFLRAHDPSAPFFLWVSFPDPHHPWDPPASEHRRVPWRDVPLPEGHPGKALYRVLADKPRHWLDWYEGRFHNPEGGSSRFVPARLQDDQLREINALVHVENELVDEAVGRLLAFLRERGLDEDTDVFFTSDHGELQGDFGLLFKGPYHVDALLKVPLVWRPAPSAGVAPAVVREPVGLVDLAPTFCAIAGLPVPPWMEGTPLPTSSDAARRFVLTEWDSQFRNVGMHLRTMFEDRWLVTSYLASTRDEGGRFPILEATIARPGAIPHYTGEEGELYDVVEDPLQRRNLWDDPRHRSTRDDLVATLRARLPRGRAKALPVTAPV